MTDALGGVGKIESITGSGQPNGVRRHAFICWISASCVRWTSASMALISGRVRRFRGRRHVRFSGCLISSA